MAVRGRPATSMTHEQMATLGLVGKDLQQQSGIVAPPPVFPALMSKPVPLESSAARDYKILWKEDFISFLKDSPYFTHPAVVANSAKVQRYSDKYVNALSSKRDQLAGDFAWSRMPAELRPNFKRKAAASSANGGASASKQSAKLLRVSALDARTVEDKLKALEEKEQAKGGADGEPTTSAAKKANRDSDDEEADDDGDDGDEQDEEMDEENDYGNSYFDNGDEYNEEDDNLDDGPVY